MRNTCKICKLILVLCIIILSFGVINVSASFNIYTLDELELKTSMPDDYFVFTRDMPSNSQVLSNLGLTKSDVIEQFEAFGIYLNAFSDTYNEEIVVTMFENDLSYFSLLSDIELDIFASTMLNQVKELGISVENYEIYQHPQTKFIKWSFFDKENSVYGSQYSTLYDGKVINFTLRSYEGSLSSKQETTIKNIVDKIEFYKDPPILEQGESTNSFIYTDNDSNITFTVPDNWKQEEFTEDREFIDAKFVSTKEKGCTMIYGSTDMWEQMSASDKAGYTRSDLNNSFFAKSDIAEMYSTTADNITTVTYNGIEYFKGELNTLSTYGIDFRMTQLIFIDNGWMYMFQFSGTSTHKLYSEFESLLESVKYPTITNANNAVSSFDKALGVIAIVIFFVAILIIIIAITVSRKKNIDMPLPDNYTLIDNTSKPQRPNNAETNRYCRNCGQALPLDSDFCHQCGTKIIKENNVL
ncbi:MAG: hypothetical protein IJ323_00615 [Clostridia bacterium]|nr:hypothetical protein [Clostridia bacterium]